MLTDNIAVISSGALVGVFVTLAGIAFHSSRSMQIHSAARRRASQLVAIIFLWLAGIIVASVLVAAISIDWLNALYGAVGGSALVAVSFAAGSGLFAPQSREQDRPTPGAPA